MTTFDVFNMKREKVGSIDLADEVFGTEVREHLFYEVVKAQLASKRQGTQCAKNRSAVSGSTKKMYKQKGTGQARHGSNRAPIFVGGARLCSSEDIPASLPRFSSVDAWRVSLRPDPNRSSANAWESVSLH